MITITPDSQLADIVIDRPAAARVFDTRAIDYCCNGHRPLRDACDAAGLPVQEVIDELTLVDDVPVSGPAHDDVGALIGHIVSTHHRYLRRELPRLADLMSKVVAAHGERHPEVLEVATLLTELSDDLLPHLDKEERVLFPLAIQLLGAVEPTTFHCGSVSNPLSVMFAEHDRAGELLEALRDRTDGYRPPADACPTFHALYAGLAELEADTHRHVHLENNLLFPAIAAAEARLG